MDKTILAKIFSLIAKGRNSIVFSVVFLSSLNWSYSQNNSVFIVHKQKAFIGLKNAIHVCMQEVDSLYAVTGEIIYERNEPKFWIPNYGDFLICRKYDHEVYTYDTVKFTLSKVIPEGVRLVNQDHNYSTLEQFEGITFYFDQDLSATNAFQAIQTKTYELVLHCADNYKEILTFDSSNSKRFYESVRERAKHKACAGFSIQKIELVCDSCGWPQHVISMPDLIISP